MFLVGCGPDARAGRSADPPTSSNAVTSNPVSATLALTAPAAVVFGSPATVTFHLTADGTGIAAAATTVSVDAEMFAMITDDHGSGSIELDPRQLAAGSTSVTVRFAGDHMHTAAIGRTSISVAPAVSAIRLDVAAAPTGSGTVTAAVSASSGVAVSGAVSFTIGGQGVGSVPVDQGVAAFQIPAGYPIGDHIVEATFTPTTSTQLRAATQTAMLTVSRAVARLSATASKDAVRYGDRATIEIAVTPVGDQPGLDLAGPVSVLAGDTEVVTGATDTTGHASLPFYNRNVPGDVTYTVRFSGNDRVEPAAVEFVLHTTTTNVDLAIDRPTVHPGDSGTIVVRVIGTPDPPTGNATLLMNGSPVAAGPLDDRGRLGANMENVAAGTHALRVEYSGDARFDGASASVSWVVKAPPVNPNGAAAASLQAANPCPASASACVDLSSRRAWLQSAGVITYGPVAITSGRSGYRTPTGMFGVFWLDKNHKSSLFNNAPMPNSVFFNGGIAFHAGSLSAQSHGCIHLSTAASTVFFSQLAVGDAVYVFGAAPY